MLASDDKKSVLLEVSEQGHEGIAYSVYGYGEDGSSHLGYNGELRDSLTGQYFLGQGYRMFNPRLMRFLCPDGALWSPFGKGGVNPYAYVLGNPMGYSDPSGNMPLWKAMGVLMFSSSSGSTTRGTSSLVQTTFSAGDPLAGYTMTTGKLPTQGRNVSAAMSQGMTSQAGNGGARVGRPKSALKKSGVGQPQKPKMKVEFDSRVKQQTFDRDPGLGWTTQADEVAATAEYEAQGGIAGSDRFLYNGNPPLPSKALAVEGDAIRKQLAKRATREPAKQSKKPLSVIQQARLRSSQ